MADDPRKRAQRVIKSGIALLVTLTVVGLIAFVVSLPDNSPTGVGTAKPSPTDFKAIARASAEARRVDASIRAWGSRVSSVCANGKNAFPNIKYGTNTRVVDMQSGVHSLTDGVLGVQRPANPTAATQIEGLLKEAADVDKVWIELGARKVKIPEAELFASVDRLRAFMSQLITLGAKTCEALLPGPNGPPAA